LQWQVQSFLLLSLGFSVIEAAQLAEGAWQSPVKPCDFHDLLRTVSDYAAQQGDSINATMRRKAI